MDLANRQNFPLVDLPVRSQNGLCTNFHVAPSASNYILSVSNRIRVKRNLLHLLRRGPSFLNKFRMLPRRSVSGLRPGRVSLFKKEKGERRRTPARATSNQQPTRCYGRTCTATPEQMFHAPTHLRGDTAPVFRLRNIRKSMAMMANRCYLYLPCERKYLSVPPNRAVAETRRKHNAPFEQHLEHEPRYELGFEDDNWFRWSSNPEPDRGQALGTGC
ncbi:hypothetical protein BKA63DRAFT_491778 [Paraphoma chrysanthemicola]|nr:hypothetical protein BKA63DRAFT_491778 [Paraphoma chrysanthemicola]